MWSSIRSSSSKRWSSYLSNLLLYRHLIHKCSGTNARGMAKVSPLFFLLFLFHTFSTPVPYQLDTNSNAAKKGSFKYVWVMHKLEWERPGQHHQHLPLALRDGNTIIDAPGRHDFWITGRSGLSPPSLSHTPSSPLLSKPHYHHRKRYLNSICVCSLIIVIHQNKSINRLIISSFSSFLS